MQLSARVCRVDINCRESNASLRAWMLVNHLGSFNSEEELIQSWYKTKKLVVLLINVWMHILFSFSIINPKISKHTRSCCVRYLLECLTTCMPFEKAEDGFQSHKNNFKFRAWRKTFAYLHLMKEHYWQMLKKYFSIENWILCIKLVNVNKDRSLLVSSHICKIQEM